MLCCGDESSMWWISNPVAGWIEDTNTTFIVVGSDCTNRVTESVCSSSLILTRPSLVVVDPGIMAK